MTPYIRWSLLDRSAMRLAAVLLAVGVLGPHVVAAQGLTGTLIGTVKDAQGGVLPGAVVTITSTALIGGTKTITTDDKGHLRFVALPPGQYALDIQAPGFAVLHDNDIRIGAGSTIERTAILTLAAVAESLVVEGASSRIDARNPGFEVRFWPDDLKTIPTRRASMFDSIRAAPGVSPTSPSSGTVTTVSAFGSGTNENQFLIDGTNFTCPCNGIARSEPGTDFIQEVQIQAVGASAEFGNVQGAVINVITRQGGERFRYDAAYYGQTSALTSQPVLRPFAASPTGQTGYERALYRDFTTSVGGPAVANRVWFFAGYQYLRDYDSQPGTDPTQPRRYEQNKMFAKLTSQLAPGWQLVNSIHYEAWVNPDQPTLAKPFDVTLRSHATVPAMTFGNLTHTSSTNTLWDMRVGRFVYTRQDDPSTGDFTTQGHTDNLTGVASVAPQTFSSLTLIRTTAKMTVSHYQTGLLGADHEWKIGGQIERGEHRTPSVVPGGIRYIDQRGAPFRAVSIAPSNSGGVFITPAVFASDAVTVGDRVTISAGLRFDHSRAISQDVPAVDAAGHDTGHDVPGLGTLYTWNLFSPRLGVVTKLTADGRTILRASFGRFNQGVLTGELGLFHPAVAPTITTAFDPATGGYTTPVSMVDPAVNLRIDPHTRAPHSDEYSIGVDRQIASRLTMAVAYVRKNGANFIGWTDVAGQYRADTRLLPDGRSISVLALDTAVTPTDARRFLLTNQDDYSLTYNGLVIVAEKRPSHGWQAFGSYTLSRTYGLQPASGSNAASAQVSTVAPPPVPQGVVFGRDPNDLINARGRLPNDRPHVFRAMSSLDVPRTGVVFAANFQFFSGKPWAASALVPLPQTGNQPTQRVLLETPGTRRLASQSLLDVRVSRSFDVRGMGHLEFLLDVLNTLNDTAGDGLVTDNLFSPTFNGGQPTVFMDPRRAMISVRLDLGR
jgi:hypothetical protein